MNDSSVPPDPICFGRTALELNPRFVGDPSPAEHVAFRAADLRKKTRKRLRRLEELLDEGALPVDLSWRGKDAAHGGHVRTSEALLRDLSLEDKRMRLFWRTCLAARAPRPAPRIIGIVNVTPDSFSDGGRFLDPAHAVEHGLALIADGADALDVGGESTRPGSEPVSVEEECARVAPVIAGLRRAGAIVPISVDTQKSVVASVGLDAGATWVNDVSAGSNDPDMLALVAERECDLTLMHMQGTPRDMQRDPNYVDVVDEVLSFLRERVAACLKAGIALSRISVDPGIGFGKRLEHNLELLRRMPELRSLGLPLYLGVSKKSFIAHVNEAAGILSDPFGALDDDPQTQRLGGTAAAIGACVLGGASWLRVHDVRVMGEAARVAAAVHGTNVEDEGS